MKGEYMTYNIPTNMKDRNMHIEVDRLYKHAIQHAVQHYLAWTYKDCYKWASHMYRYIKYMQR